MSAARHFPVRSRRPALRSLRARRGIGLAEVIVGAGLALFLVAGIYAFYRGQLRALRAQASAAEAAGAARAALELMAREIRMAAYDPTGLALPLSPGPDCPGAPRGIVDAGRWRLRIQQDLNGDGVIGGPGEDVAYELVGSEIVRTDSGVSTTLAYDVPAGGLLFRYFNAGDPPVELVPAEGGGALSAGQRDCTAKVRIEVRVAVGDRDPGSNRVLIGKAATEVAIRNRVLNNF